MSLTWLQRSALWLYGWAMWALLPLLRRKLRRRGAKEPGYLLHPEQRWGLYPGVAPQTGAVWVHAVSLGETRAAAILLKALREQQPGVRILLTHGTATGWQEGTRLLQAGDVQVWQPWDTPSVLQRFLARFQPRMGVVLETEVWPHWVQACAERGLPLHLVNARLSERSLNKAWAQRWLALPAYGRLHSVLPQTEADAQRLRQLGAPVKAVMGNLKYDVSVNPDQQALGLRWRQAAARPVVMLASSREGEEAQCLDVIRQLGEAADTVQWLLVPRHPQRFYAVAQLIEQAGWRVARRSQWALDTPPPTSPDAPRTLWLGDSLGEMQAYYHLASVAWLGGSFEPLGGQNLIEAAACGCPIVMGPHTFNFADAAEQAQQSSVAIRVATMEQAWVVTNRLVLNPNQINKIGLLGKDFIGAHSGSALKCANELSKPRIN